MRNPNINVAVMILACVIVIVPSFSFAQITSTTEASSSSGGNTSGSSGYVLEGSSSASANATSIINARGEGEVEIEVETESNGVIHKESLRERINAMEAVKIRIATSSRGADARSEIRINMGEERPAAGTSTPRVSDMFRSWVDRLLLPRATRTDASTEGETEEDVETSTALSPTENNASKGGLSAPASFREYILVILVEIAFRSRGTSGPSPPALFVFWRDSRGLYTLLSTRSSPCFQQGFSFTSKVLPEVINTHSSPSSSFLEIYLCCVVVCFMCATHGEISKAYHGNVVFSHVFNVFHICRAD